MRRPSIAIAAALFALVCVSPARQVPPDAGQEREAIMREKLALAQGLLAAMAGNDLDKASGDAAALAALTRDARWRVRETPEYRSRSEEFERAANALASAAGGGNGDAAALAWIHVNVQCLECHRWARGSGR
jgi:cytochrome c556